MALPFWNQQMQNSSIGLLCGFDIHQIQSQISSSTRTFPFHSHLTQIKSQYFFPHRMSRKLLCVRNSEWTQLIITRIQELHFSIVESDIDYFLKVKWPQLPEWEVLFLPAKKKRFPCPLKEYLIISLNCHTGYHATVLRLFQTRVLPWEKVIWSKTVQTKKLPLSSYNSKRSGRSNPLRVHKQT